MNEYECYESSELVQEYERIGYEWGLWESEADLITKYCSNCKTVVDIGCGTGRVSLALSRLWFEKILGIDVSTAMIKRARDIAKSIPKISYECLNIVDVSKIGRFDAAIFAYNGIMSIVGHSSRLKALRNIYRALNNGGYFIFTTHRGIDDQESEFKGFWELRASHFLKNGLPTFDDQFYTLKVEDKGEIITQFFAKDSEIIDDLNQCGFVLLDSFLRDSRYIEKESVANETNNCRMWVCQK